MKALSLGARVVAAAALVVLLLALLAGDWPGLGRTLSRAGGADRAGAPPAWGPVEMDVIFPFDPDRPREPLVVTAGSPLYGETLNVLYQPGNRLVLEYRARAGEPVLSRPFPFEPGQVYRLHYEAGSLFPAATDGFFAGRRPLEVGSLKRWVRVMIDGEPLIDRATEEITVDPGAISIGTDKRAGEDGRFSGLIRRIQRALAPVALPAGRPAGDVILTLNAAGGAPGAVLPLLAADTGGKSELLGLQLRGSGEYVLVFRRAGSPPVESRVFPLPESGAVELRIRFGPLLDVPASSPLAILRESLAVWIDGKPAWWIRLGPAGGAPGRVTLLENPGASGPEAREFAGRLAGWRLESPPAPWPPGPFRRITLLIGGRGTVPEPIVATGAAGAANTLAIDWLPGGRARFVYDHWGVGASTSPEIEWPEGTAHSVAVEAPAFPALGASRGPAGSGALRVLVDGREVWNTPASFHAAAAESLAVGRNTAGSSIAASTLSAVVLDISQ